MPSSLYTNVYGEECFPFKFARGLRRILFKYLLKYLYINKYVEKFRNIYIESEKGSSQDRGNFSFNQHTKLSLKDSSRSLR